MRRLDEDRGATKIVRISAEGEETAYVVEQDVGDDSQVAGRWGALQSAAQIYLVLNSCRAGGEVTIHLLGIGIDPLSAVCDLLVVVVFDGDTFDALLGNSLHANAEGRLVTERGGRDGIAGFPFTGEAASRLIAEAPMQAAGAGLLELAWRHRSALHLNY